MWPGDPPRETHHHTMIRKFVFVGCLFLSCAWLCAQAPEGKPVAVKVRLPKADTELWIQNRPTQQTGLVRSFISPPLEPCRGYVYHLKAVWAPNGYSKITRERSVSVRA